MNRLQEAKYEMITENDYHRYFCLPDEIKKNTDIVKICFRKYHESVKKISTIFGEYLKYHDITEQGSLELIIMLKNILTDKQKEAISFNLYDELLKNIVSSNDFEELYNKYKNKTVLHYLVDKYIELILSGFKMNTTSTEAFIEDITKNIDPILGVYLKENSNILNKYIKPQEKKLIK